MSKNWRRQIQGLNVGWFSYSLSWVIRIHFLGQEPCSSGYGRRHMFRRWWVQIPATYTGRTFFHISICCKICNNVCFLKSGPFPASFLFIFVFSVQLIINKCSIKFCRWLEANRGPLVLKATALPTEPQPLPYMFVWKDRKINDTEETQITFNDATRGHNR